jgi:flavin reductase (DIM6/NTAB) family NADH-FMN oxidoreductase RutF
MNTAAASLADSSAREPAPQAFDALQLRRAFGSFGTGVTVVTTLGAGGRLVGVTANSFCSVSLAPPIVLWSLNRHSASLPAFQHCGRFVVNVLALAQMAVSRRFAHPRPEQASDKFDGVAHRRTAQGLPLLEGCVATFDCRTEQQLEVGDHMLFLGRVEAFEHHPGTGLLYCQGHYAQGVGLDTT